MLHATCWPVLEEVQTRLPAPVQNKKQHPGGDMACHHCLPAAIMHWRSCQCLLLDNGLLHETAEHLAPKGSNSWPCGAASTANLLNTSAAQYHYVADLSSEVCMSGASLQPLHGGIERHHTGACYSWAAHPQAPAACHPGSRMLLQHHTSLCTVVD